MSTAPPSRALRDAAAVEPLAPGHFAVQLSELYTVAGHPHGGFLQCVMASGALGAASEAGAAQLHTTAITTNFAGAPVVGDAELHAAVRRVGRGVTFVHVVLRQAGVEMIESLVTLGTLREDSVVRYADAPGPAIAPLPECRQSTGSEEVNIMRVLDQRLDPAYAQWRGGEFSDRGEVRGWLRLDDDDATWNAWNVLFATDAMPPATFPLGSSGWVPTLQLTSYVRRIPVGEWLVGRQWCVSIADGLVDERCELFDERGELVASSSQLAMVRFPGAH